MNGSDLSDYVKLGLCMLLMVFTFGTGYNLFYIAYTPINKYVTDTQSHMNGADMITITDLCTVGEVNGATLYTAMAQYGSELAGIVWEVDDSKPYASKIPSSRTRIDGKCVYATGYNNSVEDLLADIGAVGYDTQFSIVRSEPIDGIDYQPQTMFIGIKVVTE